MLRIGYDVRDLELHMGMGIYCYSLLQALAQYDDIETVLFSDARISDPLQDVATCSVVKESFFENVWEERYLPRLIRSERIDIFHNVRNVGLPPCEGIPMILTIHDITSLRHRDEDVSDHVVRDIHQAYQKAIKRADHIIVVSDHTRQDIEDMFSTKKDRISMIYEGVAQDFVSQAEGISDDLPSDFLLYVGSLGPNKNFEALLEVMQRLPASMHLCVICAQKYRSAHLMNTLKHRGLEGRIHFRCHVPRTQLAYYYRQARLFVFPSLYEGFGLILLEAMACACPVVAFENSSIPEVVGPGGVLVPDNDIQAFVQTIRDLVRDETRYHYLQHAALDQSQKFCWQKCAHNTRKVYERYSYAVNR